jgi:hypothetical protein
MTRLDAQLEQRINAHLDGRLDADETAELYRHLLRHPEARDVMDRYAANDRDASLALQAVIMAPSQSIDGQTWTRRRRWRIPWAQVAATAALVLVAAGVWIAVDHLPAAPSTPDDPASQTVAGVEPDPAAGSSPAQAPPATAIDNHTPPESGPAPAYVLAAMPELETEPWWRPKPDATGAPRSQVADAEAAAPQVSGPRHIQRLNHRALLGVVDDHSERIYWMQVDREQIRVSAVGSEL